MFPLLHKMQGYYYEGKSLKPLFGNPPIVIYVKCKDIVKGKSPNFLKNLRFHEPLYNGSYVDRSSLLFDEIEQDFSKFRRGGGMIGAVSCASPFSRFDKGPAPSRVFPNAYYFEQSLRRSLPG